MSIKKVEKYSKCYKHLLKVTLIWAIKAITPSEFAW